MRIKLVKGDNELLLSRNFRLNNFNYKTRNRFELNALQHGGANVGVNLYNFLEFDIEGSFKANGALDADLQIDEFLSWLYANNGFKLYVVDYKDNVYLSDCYFIENTTETYVKGDYVKITVKIQTNPFWREDLETAEEQGTSFTINNTCGYNVYPKLIITAVNNMSTFKITNKTDNNREFVVTYPDWVSSMVGEFDSENNTAIINEQNILEYTNGNFLKLLPGENTLQTNETVTLKVVYYKLYTY